MRGDKTGVGKKRKLLDRGNHRVHGEGTIREYGKGAREEHKKEEIRGYMMK